MKRILSEIDLTVLGKFEKQYSHRIPKTLLKRKLKLNSILCNPILKKVLHIFYKMCTTKAMQKDNILS